MKSPCITEEMHLSPPLHRAETDLRKNLEAVAAVPEVFARSSGGFRPSLTSRLVVVAAAAPLLKTDITSLVCRHIIEIWPV